MTSSAVVQVSPVQSEHTTGVADLFDRASVPCFCQYYQFGGDHREWQLQCANEPEKNRKALEGDLSAGRLRGFVALHDDVVVGWMRLAEPSSLSKLYQGRLYRGLPCFESERDGTWAVACFLVDPSHRREGVARRLLQSAIAVAKREGVRRLEAFPRGATDVTDEEQWHGPTALFKELGFAIVHDFAPYPVLRLALV